MPLPTEPTVCAILLTHDRPEMARRAVECFRAQTYGTKVLFGLDTAEHHAPGLPWGDRDATVMWSPGLALTVGELRNYAIRAALGHHDFDAVVHWDDDDWSHPNRIAEQVALLQRSGADCVGYNEMLFWRERRRQSFEIKTESDLGLIAGEAWLYSNPNPGYSLGTSLCYWRKTWERKQFRNTSVGEDMQFITGLKCVGVPAFGCKGEALHDPRMIARIHGGNTSNAYTREKMEAESQRPQPHWRRVPEWDAHCRSIMEGK